MLILITLCTYAYSSDGGWSACFEDVLRHNFLQNIPIALPWCPTHVVPNSQSKPRILTCKALVTYNPDPSKGRPTGHSEPLYHGCPGWKRRLSRGLSGRGQWTNPRLAILVDRWEIVSHRPHQNWDWGCSHRHPSTPIHGNTHFNGLVSFRCSLHQKISCACQVVIDMWVMAFAKYYTPICPKAINYANCHTKTDVHQSVGQHSFAWSTFGRSQQLNTFHFTEIVGQLFTWSTGTSGKGSLHEIVGHMTSSYIKFKSTKLHNSELKNTRVSVVHRN